MRTRKLRVLLTTSLILAWLIAISVGMGLLAHFETSAGEISIAPSHWPSGCRSRLDSNVPTVLIFVHPHCPCSRATFTQLERVLTRYPVQFDTQVWFIRPADADDEWEQSDLRSRVEKLPGVQCQWDANGSEARVFGARTSGHIVVYSPMGELMYQGGITTGRGNDVGTSLAEPLEAIANGDPVANRVGPVFGCPLTTSPDIDGGVNSCPCSK